MNLMKLKPHTHKKAGCNDVAGRKRSAESNMGHIKKMCNIKRSQVKPQNDGDKKSVREWSAKSEVNRSFLRPKCASWL